MSSDRVLGQKTTRTNCWKLTENKMEETGDRPEQSPRKSLTPLAYEIKA
jgi:hypothetical protein